MNNLSETLESSLKNPVSSTEFDLEAALDEGGVGLRASDSGGKFTFYGKDPMIPSPVRFGTMAAISLAAKASAAAAIWRFRSGEGQDIHVDVRKALRRFAPFFEREWERVNGHQASFASDPENRFIHYPSMTLWHKTRDGRWIMPGNIYPRLRARATTLLRCDDSVNAVQNAILQWRADELETAAAEAGLPFAMLRTTEEFMKEIHRSTLERSPDQGREDRGE
jgi:hypothetical protein